MAKVTHQIGVKLLPLGELILYSLLIPDTSSFIHETSPLPLLGLLLPYFPPYPWTFGNGQTRIRRQVGRCRRCTSPPRTVYYPRKRSGAGWMRSILWQMGQSPPPSDILIRGRLNGMSDQAAFDRALAVAQLVLGPLHRAYLASLPIPSADFNLQFPVPPPLAAGLITPLPPSLTGDARSVDLDHVSRKGIQAIDALEVLLGTGWTLGAR